MSWARRIGLSVAFVVAAVDVVAAHDIGGTRFDSPLPLTVLFLGAGATVGLTAAWLGRSEDLVPTETRTVGRLSAETIQGIRLVRRFGFTAVVVFAVIRGLVGRQVAAENVATVFVWPLWLKGLGLVSILVGSPWRALSPCRGAHAVLEFFEGSRVRLRVYPEPLGVWPAVVGFVVVVGVIENLTVIPRSPRLTVGFVALYAVVMVLGGTLFGRAWFRHADVFEVLYRQFGRVAPVHVRARNDEYVLETRFPWEECSSSVAEPGILAFIVAMVYTVSFDGFTNTPEYQQLLFAVRDVLTTGALTGVILYIIGFVGFVLSFVGAAAAVERLGNVTERSAIATARAFAPTVVPIAVAYELAHNYPFVLRNLAQALELGLHAVGQDQATVSLLGWLSLPVFWGTQVLLIVVGHVVAVVAAHEVAVHRYEPLARARRAHLPLVVVMIGYTVLSLWIISRPVVSG
ncbi:hypothetical protein [Halorussus sp. AFM4]|uniref:hypothetical protein n=1 Tax=Halorussus sp. AFM4 TaxID=3421651 RepID=UPI003EB8F1A6